MLAVAPVAALLAWPTLGSAATLRVCLHGCQYRQIQPASPESIPFTGKPNVIGAGGGIEIPPGKDLSAGARVTIMNSAISNNRAAPTDTAFGGEPC